MPFVSFVVSCHKSGEAGGAVSINIVNAMAKSTPIIPVVGSGAGITWYKTAQAIVYSNAQLYSPYSGANPLYITSSLDSNRRLFNGNFDFAAGKMYSFFLAGDTTRPDTLFVQDNIPVFNDSAAGVRFVHMVPDGKPIKVNVKGNPASQTEFSGLSYRQASAFKKYAATSSVSGSQYVFEVRNQDGDSLLFTYTWSYTRYKNNTLVLSGSAVKGSTTPLKLLAVKNY